MQRVRVLAAAIGVAVAMGVAGCGDDEESSSTSEALPEAEFLTQGNEICAAGNAEIEEASADIQSQAEGEAFFTETAIPIIQGQIDDIGELQPPAELESDVDELLTAAQSALDELEADPAAGLGGGGPDPFAPVNEMALEIGLEECAN